ncbi:MAG: hypothetical protein RIT45_2474 [Pseudomonadota bacterium]|jgi:hypothetical protein
MSRRLLARGLLLCAGLLTGFGAGREWLPPAPVARPPSTPAGLPARDAPVDLAAGLGVWRWVLGAPELLPALERALHAEGSGVPAALGAPLDDREAGLVQRLVLLYDDRGLLSARPPAALDPATRRARHDLHALLLRPWLSSERAAPQASELAAIDRVRRGAR